MQSAAKHLAWGTDSIGATVLSTTTSEMLRCALHDRPLLYRYFGTGLIPYRGRGAFPAQAFARIRSLPGPSRRRALEAAHGPPVPHLHHRLVQLALVRTSYVWQPAFEANYALGYNEQGQALLKHKRSKAGAAGSMEITPTDYATFLAAVMQGKLMRPATQAEMSRAQVRIPFKGQFGPLATVAAPEATAPFAWRAAWAGARLSRPTATPTSKKATTTAGKTTALFSGTAKRPSY